MELNYEIESPIVEDVVNSIITKYSNDILTEKDKKQSLLNIKHIKIQTAIAKEKEQISTLKNNILENKNKLKKYISQYISEKLESKTFEEDLEKKKVQNENLINIYNAKIMKHNDYQLKLNNHIHQEQHKYLDKKRIEDDKMRDEIRIFEAEISRIRTKKEFIEIDLQKQLAIMVRDLEAYDQKIINKHNIINILQNEVNNIEKGNCQSRRQIIKNNKSYLIKSKNLKKIKNKLQYQIANMDIEIYTVDQQLQDELDEIRKANVDIQATYRSNINELNIFLGELTEKASKLKYNAVDMQSKTWSINYKNAIDNVDNTHLKLTDEIQAFNSYLGIYNSQIKDIETKYKFIREVKANKLFLFQTKLNKLSKSEDNKICKLSSQHQLNNKVTKYKIDLLNKEYNNLEQIQKEKYECQKLVQKYELDTNRQIEQLGNDLERSQNRLKISSNRILDVLKAHKIGTDTIKKKYKEELNNVNIEISNCIDTLQNLERTVKSENKVIKERKDNFKHTRRNIKDIERTIKEQTRQLDGITIKAEKRIETIIEKEYEVINEKIKADMDYITKLNEIDKLQDVSIDNKITVLNKLMNITIRV